MVKYFHSKEVIVTPLSLLAKLQLTGNATTTKKNTLGKRTKRRTDKKTSIFEAERTCKDSEILKS